MAHLRGADGCPWDRAQDYDSLKALLLEEAYEVIDAVHATDFDALQDELGDLLFQVVFYARLAEEDGRFDFNSVVERVHAKLVRRHPHVFGGKRAKTPEEALRSWTAVKEQETRERRQAEGTASGSSVLDGIVSALPSTVEAYELGLRASEAGFDWRKPEEVLDKAKEEIGELQREIAKAGNGGHRRAQEETGDLLFTLANLARHLGSDPESCLRAANQKFKRRFQSLEREAAKRGKKLEDYSIGELEDLWQAVKAGESQ